MSRGTTAATALAQTGAASNGPAVCQNWDELAARVKERWEEAVKNTNAVFYGGLALGALIVTFAERPEIAAEAEAAKVHRRGPKFTNFGWVAAELARRAGPFLPGTKYMVSCARAAEIARKKGIAGGDVYALLGWKSGSLPQVIKEAALLQLPGAEEDELGGQRAPMDGPEFTHYALVRLGVLERLAQDLAARKPTGYRLPWPKGRHDFKRTIGKINDFLKYLNLALVDRR